MWRLRGSIQVDFLPYGSELRKLDLTSRQVICTGKFQKYCSLSPGETPWRSRCQHFLSKSWTPGFHTPGCVWGTIQWPSWHIFCSVRTVIMHDFMFMNTLTNHWLFVLTADRTHPLLLLWTKPLKTNDSHVWDLHQSWSPPSRWQLVRHGQS